MAKPRYLMKTGFILSLLAIFYVALGAPILHPFCHDLRQAGHELGAHGPAHHQLTAVESSDECVICSFLNLVQLLDETPLRAMTPLPVGTENAVPDGQAPPRKLFDPSCHSRAPPLSHLS